MNKKTTLIIGLLLAICIGTISTCVVVSKAAKSEKSAKSATEANVPVKNEKNGEPAGGYFHYFGEDYPVYDPEQWTMINKELQQLKVRGKEILNKLGVLTEKQLNCTMEDVRKCLSELKTERLSLSEGDNYVVSELNKVAGCFESAGGSGFTTYHYALSDGTGCIVQLGGIVSIGSDTVFIPGYGYNAEGWDMDWIEEQNRQKDLQIKDED